MGNVWISIGIHDKLSCACGRKNRKKEVNHAAGYIFEGLSADYAASYDVKVGDVIEIAFGQRTLKVQVAAVEENAKKDEAAAMYKEI